MTVTSFAFVSAAELCAVKGNEGSHAYRALCIQLATLTNLRRSHLPRLTWLRCWETDQHTACAR